jgi:hypothetical protein
MFSHALDGLEGNFQQTSGRFSGMDTWPAGRDRGLGLGAAFTE